MRVSLLSRPLQALLAVLFAAGISPAARAQGILIPIPRPGPPVQPFCVKSVRISSVITDAAAETTVEQVFANTAPFDQEGTYLFPLPDGATVTSFTLRAGDRVIEGRMLSKEEARAVYESIVRRRRDPGLLEYVGRGLFRASVFPIPPHGERTLTLKYVEVLKPEGGVRKFAYPLTTGRYSTRPVETESVTVKIKTGAPLKTVYSPTHDVSVRRLDDYTATASWEGKGYIPDRDFLLYYATSPSDVGLSLLTYQSGERDGYFMLIASPRYSVPKDRILPKQVVFVLDRTGSMASGHKIEQARNALQYCLDKLNPNDRFDVITFNESPDVLTRSLMPASDANVAKARRFVRDIDASGGTNIDEALRTALGLLRKDPGSQKMVVFLTDGVPTVGQTNTEQILADVRDINQGEHLASTGDEPKEAAAIKARVFCFGVGYDVNVPFLDRLAEETRAEADYVRPEENIESIVSSFYSKISSPILANLRLAFGGVETYDIYPKELPDLFKGGELVITGRYRGDGPGSVRLAGFAMGREQIFRLERAFGDDAARSSLVPRIWAMRKIGYLLDQVRLHRNQEVIDEIVRLSRDYGIITPYTSYLADERQDAAFTPGTGPGGFAYRLNTAVTGEALNMMRQDINSNSDARDAVGLRATYRALNSRGYQEANQAPANSQLGQQNGAFVGRAPAAGGFGGYGGAAGPAGPVDRGRIAGQFGAAEDAVKTAPGQADGKEAYKQVQEVARVQAVAGRTFYRRGGIWFDNAYQPGTRVVKVKALSDAYFDLLHARPELNRYASVGDEVVLSLGKVAVQFGAEGKEKLTAEELKELTGR